MHSPSSRKQDQTKPDGTPSTSDLHALSQSDQQQEHRSTSLQPSPKSTSLSRESDGEDQPSYPDRPLHLESTKEGKSRYWAITLYPHKTSITAFSNYLRQHKHTDWFIVSALDVQGTSQPSTLPYLSDSEDASEMQLDSPDLVSSNLDDSTTTSSWGLPPYSPTEVSRVHLRKKQSFYTARKRARPPPRRPAKRARLIKDGRDLGPMPTWGEILETYHRISNNADEDSTDNEVLPSLESSDILPVHMGSAWNWKVDSSESSPGCSSNYVPTP